MRTIDPKKTLAKYLKEKTTKLKARRATEKQLKKEAKIEGQKAYDEERRIFLTEQAIAQGKKRARKTKGSVLKDLQKSFKLGTMDYKTTPKKNGAQRSKKNWDLMINEDQLDKWNEVTGLYNKKGSKKTSWLNDRDEKLQW